MFLNENLFTDFLSEKEILWLGIDFSKAKFTKKGFDISQDNLRQLFNEWNLLIISDQKKYDIRLSFRKPIMSYDLSTLSKRNRSIRLSSILREHIHLNDLLPLAFLIVAHRDGHFFGHCLHWHEQRAECQCQHCIQFHFV